MGVVNEGDDEYGTDLGQCEDLHSILFVLLELASIPRRLFGVRGRHVLRPAAFRVVDALVHHLHERCVHLDARTQRRYDDDTLTQYSLHI